MGRIETIDSENAAKRYPDAEGETEEFHLFGHMCQMKDGRSTEFLLLGLMDGCNEKECTQILVE